MARPGGPGALSGETPAARAAAERGRAGLCADCRHVRRVQSGRGSVFYLCRRAEADPTFPRYPRLPRLACPGYDRARRGSDPGGDASRAGV